MSNKKHYYLAACELFYRKRHMSESRKLNSLVILDVPIINQHTLGHIQQLTQVRFFRSVEKPSPELNVDDVFINNIIYLGEMTEEEWAAIPKPNDDAVKDIIKKAMADAANNPVPEAIEPPQKATEAPPVSEASEEVPAPVEAPKPVEPPYLDIDPPDTKPE